MLEFRSRIRWAAYLVSFVMVSLSFACVLVSWLFPSWAALAACGVLIAADLVGLGFVVGVHYSADKAF